MEFKRVLFRSIQYPNTTTLYCCLKLSARFTAYLSRLISVTYYPLYRKFDAYHIRKSKQVLKLPAAPWHLRPADDQPTGLCGSTFQFPWSMHSVRKGIGFNLSIPYHLADCQRWFRSEERRVGKECRSRWS